ncbi:MAG: TetR/AcrR family transcriptional regulator [Nostocaceae cyanobacterium]|nr:TetR/AcrR family transcriptional regulator [Nostocaceae cyanobacterium]
MSSQSNPTRQRLINAALELFASQGVTETTTKQIAELASVNEVTLFRHFGNKHGLLLAVMQEAAVFTNLGQTLVQQANNTSSIYQALKEYATACLQALEGVPQVVRSVVGEAGQYPSENREALGRGFTQANRYVAEYFQTVIDRGQLHTHLSAEKLASLLNGMLLGYAVIEFTSEFHELWQDRHDFLENLITLFLHGAVSPLPETTADALGLVRQKPVTIETVTEKVGDLPANLVNLILQRAKKQGLQEYALMYVLFGSGLNPLEIICLERSHHISDSTQQLLEVTQGLVRQVPLNQWIMGKRYGTYTRNPLTQWLKSRKDSQSALFVHKNGQPLTETEVKQQWQELTSELLTPSGQPPTIEQAQQTWCVEMLMRGMNIEDMCILTGWDGIILQPYARRAREKAALEQAIRLDRKI